jgi:predicted TIM-barrel fold metal-dependent hydrolase
VLADAAPNVVLKLSAIASSADPMWTVDSVRPVVLRAIEAFGSERCMFASNWPIDRLYGMYPRLIRAYRQIASEMSEREQADLLHRTADRIYRI